MLKIKDKIIKRHCKHQTENLIVYNIENCGECTTIYYIHCNKCGANRKDIESDGIWVKGDWEC